MPPEQEFPSQTHVPMTPLPSKSGQTTSLPSPNEEINEVYAYAKSDLGILCNYLNIKSTNIKRFKCPFHKDVHPSASITNLNGNWIFTCFSKKICGVHGDVVRIIEKQENLRGRALTSRVFEICGRENQWESIKRIHYHTEYLSKNLDLIFNPPLSFTCIYTKNKRKSSGIYSKNDMKMIKFLAKIIETAKSKIINNDRKFPCSLGEFRDGTGERKEISNKKLYILVYMGFITRIREDEIPKACIGAYKAYKTKKRHANGISWWMIPEYTGDTLIHAFEMQKRLRKHKINLNNFNEDTIRGIFGDTEADRVYIGKSTYVLDRKGKLFENLEQGLSEVG
jgi:hypothetical protein